MNQVNYTQRNTLAALTAAAAGFGLYYWRSRRAGASLRERIPGFRSVEDIMTRNPEFCLQDTPIPEIARLMVDCDCGEIPVVDGTERPSKAAA